MATLEAPSDLARKLIEQFWQEEREMVDDDAAAEALTGDQREVHMALNEDQMEDEAGLDDGEDNELASGQPLGATGGVDDREGSHQQVDDLGGDDAEEDDTQAMIHEAAQDTNFKEIEDIAARENAGDESTVLRNRYAAATTSAKATSSSNGMLLTAILPDES